MKNKKWYISDIPDLSDKLILITGGNSGLGLESAKVFVKKNAHVILTSRSIEKGSIAKNEIINITPNAKIDIMLLDISDLSSVEKFTKDFKSKFNNLNVLMNNAGIMMKPYITTKDGFESQMATNHLGHFVLSGMLIDLLIKTPNSRIVNVSSIAHKGAKLDFEDLFYISKKKYSPMKAYRRSKLANLLFTFHLQRLFEKNNLKTISVAAHPGVSHTNLANHLINKNLYKILFPLAKLLTQTPEKGALPQIRAACDPSVKGGQFYGPSGFNEIAGDPVLVKPTKTALNIHLAEKFWKESENATKFKWNLL